MSAYQLLELLLVGGAVALSASRVWRRYGRRSPVVAKGLAVVAASCGGCEGGKSCKKPAA